MSWLLNVLRRLMEGCAKHSSIFFEFELLFGAFLLPSQTVLHVHYLDISLNVQAKSRVQCGMFSLKKKLFTPRNYYV